MVGNTDEIREYISRVVPWPEADEGWVNVHWSFKGRTGKAWSGNAYRSVDGVVRMVEWLKTKPDTLDIYACMSLQSQVHETTNKAGRPHYKAVRSSENAVSLKSLYMDLDAKGGKDSYNSIEEMFDAFVGFLNATGMPKPSVKVFTGGGVHVYWVLDRPLPPTEWAVLSYALVEAANRHGLKFDSGCTIDSSRILRIPNTFNHKIDPPRPVRFLGERTETNYSVERISGILEPYKNAIPHNIKANNVDLSLFPVRPSVQDTLGAGITKTEYPPVKLFDVLPECGFLSEAVTTGGKDYANPLWNLTTLLSTFTDGGLTDAVLMARKHPGFTIESTTDLFERKKREAEHKGLGWPRCKTISATGSAPCKLCPHLVADKTPFHYAKPHAGNAGQLSSVGVAGVQAPALVPGVPVLPPGADLPQGYSRNPNGLILYESVDDNGNILKRPICNYPMTQPWLQENPHGLHFSTRTHKDAQIFILTREVGSMEMRKILQEQLVMLHNEEPKLVGEFFVSWIQKLKTTKDAVVSTTPFGWNMKDGKVEGFVYGGNLWSPNGFRVAPSPDAEIASQYTPTGSMDPWKRAAKLITDQDRPDLNAIIAASFAAPLVKFTGHDGFLLSLWSSESGIGKTTAMKIGQAVWGDPVRALQGLDDTQNAVFNKIGELRSLPLFWDELKTEDDTRRFVNGVFKMTSGKEKSRMSSQVKQRKVGTWQTLLVSASNESIIDFVASRTRMTTAGIMRVFEAEVKPGTTGQISVGEAQHTISELNDNYGGIGLEYAKHIGANFEAIRKEVMDESRLLESETKVSPDERFWCSLMSALIVGARLANKLGFTSINEKGFRQWLFKILEEMRANKRGTSNDMSKTMNVSDLLNQFLTSMGNKHTLKTNQIWTSPGKPIKNAIKVIGQHQYVDAIYVQLGMDDKLIRISSAALSKWCKENELSRHLFTRALTEKFGMKIINGVIGSGTEHKQSMGYIIEIDGGPHPELEYLFD